MDQTDAAAGSRQRVVGLADLARIPLRRWWIVLATIAVVVLGVAGYLRLVPARYTATSVVVVRAVVTDPFSYPSGGADRAVNMTAENGTATSNEVIDKVAKLTGIPAHDVRDQLQTEIPTGGQVLRFNFTGRTEAESVAGANVAAEMYLQVRQAYYEEQRASLLKSYDGTIALVKDQRNAAQQPLPNSLLQNMISPSTQAVLDQVRALNDQLAQLAEQRAKIASADLSPGVVTSAARKPIPSSHDRAKLVLAGAVLGGLLLGVVAAHLLEASDRRIRTLPQALETSGLLALGTVRRRRAEAVDTRYVALAVAEWVESRPAAPIVVLSSRDDEGRSQVAAGLSAGLAAVGHRVFLGGTEGSLAALRTALQAAQFGAPAVQAPLAHTMNGGASPGQPTEESGSAVLRRKLMAVIEAAPVVPVEPALGTVRVGGFDEPVEKGWLTVLDAPPTEGSEQGVRAARAGGAVLVVAQGRTRCADLARLVERVRAAGVDAIGFVLTGNRSG